MLMDEGLIRAQAMAVRTACAWLPAQRVSDLHERMDRASSSWAGSPWERRAAAHAHTFVLLADVSGDPVLSPVLRGAADMMRELLLAVGPGANGLVASSRRRLLARLRAGDTDGAALEIEQNLSTLCFMWRLVRSSRTSSKPHWPTRATMPASPRPR